MSGIRVDGRLETTVPGLFAAGEAVGGANGANRLSGNAITEALAFGRKAGRMAAARARGSSAVPQPATPAAGDWLRRHATRPDAPSHAASLVDLQTVMADLVGPFRKAADLERALDRIGDIRARLDERPSATTDVIEPFDPDRLDGFDLASMSLVAEVVTRAALRRQESRGAHQRLDYPQADPRWACHLDAVLDGSTIRLAERAVAARTLAA
jgi:succinate dehydrogenase/fumarate reductase flavoprotein subunit